jgi:hypothetical protein
MDALEMEMYMSMPTRTAVGAIEKAAAPAAPQTSKPRRIQVHRACDWCRLHRTKCDTTFPCRNCKSRGGECTLKGDTKTLPQSLRYEEDVQKKKTSAITHLI